MNKVFISYSGSRIDRASLFYALRDHGLNPWRDVESLELGDDTTDVIESELAQCSAAILWLNQDLLDSDYVSNVELPAIARAWQQGGTMIVPVFDGLTPEQASDEVSRRVGIEIGDLNGHSVDPALLPDDTAKCIAIRLARTHIRDARDRGAAPIVRLVSYDDTAGLPEQAVLNLDWRHHLDGGQLEPLAEDKLRSALATVSEAVKRAYGASEVTLCVKAHLALAVAIGHAFSEPTGCTLRMHRDGTAWVTVREPTAEVPLIEVEGPKGPAQTRVAALEVSISRNVEAGVNEHVQQGNRYRHRLTLCPPNGPQNDAVDGPERANLWARQVGVHLRALSDRPDVDRIDLFIAAPVEVAVLIGWWANAVSDLDNMDWTDKKGPYHRMWTLP